MTITLFITLERQRREEQGRGRTGRGLEGPRRGGRGGGRRDGHGPGGGGAGNHVHASRVVKTWHHSPDNPANKPSAVWAI